jgi:hypothetical protein
MVQPDGEDAHLGGYATNSEIGDSATFYPSLWTWAVAMFRIRSVMDVGCGEGRSTKFFGDMGCDVLGVEDYRQTIDARPLADKIVHHDFSKGPYRPDKEFDMASFEI